MGYGLGCFFVVLCMLLRATDVLFRSKTLESITALEMVTAEHMLACIFLIIFFARKFKLPKLTPFEIISLLFVGCLSSVGGILCFTAAFAHINPAVVILLQKLQPIVTILLSMLILKEYPSRAFYLLAVIAIGAGYVLSFGFSIPTFSLEHSGSKGVLYASLAVVFWGSGTVFGKVLLKKLDSNTLTQSRYYIGALFGCLLLLITGGFSSLQLPNHPELGLNIVYMALVPGFAALFFYYKGLRVVSAGMASILELAFPVASVALSWMILGKPLTLLQLSAATVLLSTIIAISALTKK